MWFSKLLLVQELHAAMGKSVVHLVADKLFMLQQQPNCCKISVSVVPKSGSPLTNRVPADQRRAAQPQALHALL
jgi:hypothetical protein